jgi:Sec-independent protein translocase protein TatA
MGRGVKAFKDGMNNDEEDDFKAISEAATVEEAEEVRSKTSV